MRISNKFKVFFLICRINFGWWVAGGVFLLIGLVGCSMSEPLPTVVPTAVLPPPPPTPLLAHAELLPLTVTAVPAPILISAQTAVPSDLRTHARRIAASQPDRFRWVTEPETADVQLTVDGGTPLATWVYAVAAPFPTIADEVTMADLMAAWYLRTSSLILPAEEAATIEWLLGPSATAVQTAPLSELVNAVWAEQPSLTILPFHQLEPRLKLMRLDGVSLLDPAQEMDAYPLQVQISVQGAETAVARFLAAWDGSTSNRDPAKMSRIAMTGVTALVRATAYQMELNGVSYPGTAVASILTSADIAHVSNEVSFAATCPYPDPIGGTTFCSRDSYFQLLQDIGVDVVELTGNHLNDWGRENLLHTLEMYAAAGMQTFGGGRDLAHAAQPLLLTHNGNRIAFVGCNPVGPAHAWATADQPGSRPCDHNFTTQIAELDAAGYVVIATQQYHEFYHYAPTAQQQADFKAPADAGATAVSGSQGHHVQGFDFHNGAFIHYGLGNLFFDQMDNLGTRQTFVDTYLVYDGQLLTVELWTGLIENYARPREMTPQERVDVLRTTFAASGW